ncbi:transglycosylase SLT domain-containing protein [Paraburkholderia tropica]|uniref:Transglycosylase SLT domain-containing protein n=1 Tax=Paraburkholderia tropica TaxID=92647 RepID=A0AAQ1GJK0_9BURK|nr:transglycosylase SLT domain-containing protein [Paraburkholderia tropica]RQN37838.1 lytic transglycosylase domain-containing protein [Paraburkholderia tropica]SEK04689.1 Transglycosylase SLT domain-containing protein [Paraburkholderia tropica]
MRRLLCLLALLPGFVQTAAAQQQPPEDKQKLPTYLTQKFGLAKEKAAQISEAVTTAAAKYSLPPAVLLAIISIESRFREKARGANNATGLMQVVPSAHRNLLRNKDLTDPDVNIDVGSSILYGYKRDAGGDLDAAMKNYGGSTAYAQKIRARAMEFSHVLDSASAPHVVDADAASASAAYTGAFSATLAAKTVAGATATASASVASSAQAASAQSGASGAQTASSTDTSSARDAARYQSRSRDR